MCVGRLFGGGAQRHLQEQRVGCRLRLQVAVVHHLGREHRVAHEAAREAKAGGEGVCVCGGG